MLYIYIKTLTINQPKEYKMLVRIKETGETKELKIVDHKTGIEWTNDLIGNATGFSEFDHDVENDIYMCDKETCNWWGDYIEKLDHAELLKFEMHLTQDELEQVYSALAGIEFDDIPGAMINVLDEIRQSRV